MLKLKKLKENQEFMEYMERYNNQKMAERYGDILNQTASEEFSYSFDEATQLNLDSETRSDFVNSRVEEAEKKAEEFFDRVQPDPDSVAKEIADKYGLSKEKIKSIWMDLVHEGKFGIF